MFVWKNVRVQLKIAVLLARKMYTYVRIRVRREQRRKRRAACYMHVIRESCSTQGLAAEHRLSIQCFDVNGLPYDVRNVFRTLQLLEGLDRTPRLEPGRFLWNALFFRLPVDSTAFCCLFVLSRCIGTTVLPLRSNSNLSYLYDTTHFAML